MKNFNAVKSLKTALIAGALATMSTNVFAEPVKYKIDTSGAHASVNFKIQHLGYSWLHGRFNSFSGDYVYDSDKVSNSKIKVVIDTASIDSNHAERDKHLRSDDFLNVSKHPKATFESTSISGSNEKLEVKGNFTLNGVTKPMVIQAHKIGEGKDPWGGYRSGFKGSAEIKLADYGITYNLGPASTVVYLDLNIEGIRQ
jgi:polyisoprenoid-binding protein YceI